MPQLDFGLNYQVTIIFSEKRKGDIEQSQQVLSNEMSEAQIKGRNRKRKLALINGSKELLKKVSWI